MNINEILKKFKEEKLKRKREYKIQLEERRRKIEEEKRNAWKLLKGKLRPASKSDYENWLRGYVKSGGMPTHYYDYNFDNRNWFVAIRDFELKPLYGANAINVIVPNDVKYNGNYDIGHCNLYFMDGYRNIGGEVPLYRDMVVE